MIKFELINSEVN